MAQFMGNNDFLYNLRQVAVYGNGAHPFAKHIETFDGGFVLSHRLEQQQDPHVLTQLEGVCIAEFSLQFMN
jgi:hypothetical protein